MIRIFLFILFFTNYAYALEFKGTFEQGSLVIGKTLPLCQIYVDKEKVKVTKDGYFLIAISRDRKNDVVILYKSDVQTKKIIKKVKARKFKVQKINGLPKRKVTPNEQDMKRIRKEGALIAKAKNTNSDLEYFFKNFIRPVDGITTGVFGSQRILNGQPRRPHYGIDIAAPKGTKVRNSNSGKVVLSEKNLFFTGGTIIIEHGHGLISIYSHLDEIFVKKGDYLERGQFIATVGSTGRSTGPH